MSTDQEKARVIKALEEKDYRVLAEDRSVGVMMEMADEWAANRARLLKATDPLGRLHVFVAPNQQVFLDEEACERAGMQAASMARMEVRL